MQSDNAVVIAVDDPAAVVIGSVSILVLDYFLTDVLLTLMPKKR